MHESSYIAHRKTLLDGKYSTTYLLQDFLLYQYDPCWYSFDINQHRSGFDSQHTQVYQGMKESFWENGYSSIGLMEIALILCDRRHRQAEETFQRLTELRVMNPEDYSVESESLSADSYRREQANYESQHLDDLAKGYLDDPLTYHRPITAEAS